MEIANPPVNALSVSVRTALNDRLCRLLEGRLPTFIVICGSNGRFVAGGDISEFGVPEQEPLLSRIVDLIEASEKPIVAAIERFALGGGLELAMACHARVARRGSHLALPEVTLGLMPGAGGTKRLPRLVGPIRALRLAMSGEQIDADHAVKLGLIDEVVEVGVVEAALRRGNLICEQGGLRRTLADDRKIERTRRNPEAFDRLAARLVARAGGQQAPAAVAASIRESFSRPVPEGRRSDGERLPLLLAGEQCKALKALFFAERRAARVHGAVQPLKLDGCVWYGEGRAPNWLTSKAGAATLAILPATSADRFPDASVIAMTGRSSTIHRRLVSRPGSNVAGLEMLGLSQGRRLATILYADDTDRSAVAALLTWARSEDMAAIAMRSSPVSALQRLRARTRAAGLDAISRDISRQQLRRAAARFGFAPWATARLTSWMPRSGRGHAAHDVVDHTLQTMLVAIAREGRKLIEDEVIADESAFTLLCVCALGWPRWRSGPLAIAEAN